MDEKILHELAEKEKERLVGFLRQDIERQNSLITKLRKSIEESKELSKAATTNIWIYKMELEDAEKELKIMQDDLEELLSA